jgi:hypothetical protein
MRSRTRWTTKEHAWLVNLIAQGKTSREAAYILGRSYSAVHIRAFLHNLRPRPERKPMPTACICKDDLIDWYALGWRFSGFSATGLCMSWPNKTEPRWPSQKNKSFLDREAA